MKADFASVGNHEFDKGSAELLRIQNGGCRADVGCTAAPYALVGGGTTNTYPGADFQYLSANVVRNDNGQTLFPAFGTRQIKGDSGRKFTIGVIGEVLEATPTIVTPAGVAGLTFQDEADAANLAVEQLRRMGVHTSVLVIHQGGFQSGTASLNGCAGNLAGSDIAEIATRLDPAIKVIVSAHTHAEYRCTITTPDGVTRLITSASSFGRILTDITLTIDDKSGELVAASADELDRAELEQPADASTDVPLLDLPKDHAGGRRRAAVRHRLGASRQPDHRQGQRRHPEHAQRARRDPIGRRDRRRPARGNAAGQPGRRPNRVHEPRRDPRRRQNGFLSPRPVAKLRVRSPTARPSPSSPSATASSPRP